MKNIRAITKAVIFVVVTLSMYTIIMVSMLLAFTGIRYEKIRGYMLRAWGRVSCYILGIQLDVKNKPPEPPFLLVSNHLSYLDVFVLFSQLRCLFVAKSDVKSWPLAGFIIKTCGILFIDRNRKRDVKRVNHLISKNINKNQGIILFAEGTTSPGIEVLPLKTSLLNYPASTGLPVSHVTLSYHTEKPDPPAYTDVCWWQDEPFMVHFWNFLKIKKTKARVVFGDSAIEGTDRKELADMLHQRISKNLKPTISRQEFLAEYGEYRTALPA